MIKLKQVDGFLEFYPEDKIDAFELGVIASGFIHDRFNENKKFTIRIKTP